MSEHQLPIARALIAVLLMAAMVLPGMPALAISPSEPGSASPRKVTDDVKDLIIPEGEVYELFGEHSFSRTVQINGTLRVIPYDGSNAATGTLELTAPWVVVGPNGKVQGDGRGYGGGGGGTCSASAQGGYAGTGGGGGNGGDPSYDYASGGGGGSNGGRGGAAGRYSGFTAGQDGTEAKGGDGGGYSGWNDMGGAGGTGFGGGGGGGGTDYQGSGGGGGGGSGGKDATSNNGGDGGGNYYGAGGAGRSGGYTNGNSGENGGYLAKSANGDTTVDTSVVRGSGGGGGGSLNYGCGAGGGGGAGGAAISLISTGDLMMAGSVTSTGGGGGAGSACWGSYSGGNAGGGAGGGILLMGLDVGILGTVDARGRQSNSLSTNNGGTVKIYFSVDSSSGSIQGGRVYKNGRPLMGELISPGNDGVALLKPTFKWEQAVDPEADKPVYQLQVAASSTFTPTIIDEDGIRSESYTSDRDLVGTEFFWRVRAGDAAGYGAWSDTWRFLTDITPPTSSVEPLVEYINALDFTVTWSGRDDSSGIGSYSIFVKQDSSAFEPWLEDVPQTAALYPGKDGHKYSFYSCAMDRARNRELAPADPDTFTTVDVTPPVSGFIGLAPYQSSKRFDVSWGGKDATSGIALYDVYYSDNGGLYSLWLQQVDRTSAQFEGKELHTYSFYTVATDRAGNVEDAYPTPDRISMTTVDLTNPATSLSVGDPHFGQNPTYITSQTPIYLGGYDACAGLNETTYIIDSRPARVFHDQITESSAGFHNMTFWSTDRADNREPDTGFWFFVDTDLPVTTVSFNGQNWNGTDRVYISTQTQIELKSFDRSSGLGSVEYNLDGRGFSTYTKPLRFETPGFHSIVYHGVDNVGNKEMDKTIKVMADSTAPVTKVSPQATTSRGSIVVSLNASDLDSGVAGTYYRVLKGNRTLGEFAAGTETTIEALDDHSLDGTYTLQFYSVDHVGNTEQTRDVKYKIDTQALLDLGFTGEPTVSEATYVIEGKAEPGARVTANGAPVVVGADGTFTYQVDLTDGRNKVDFTVTDQAGNTFSKTAYIKYSPSLASSPLVIPIILIVVVVVVVLIAVVLIMKWRKAPAPAAAPDQRVAAPPATPPPIPPPK